MKTTPTNPSPSGHEAPLHPLENGWRAWERWWFSPGSPTTLGFMRICAGLIVLYVQIGYALHLQSYVGKNAWISGEAAEYIRSLIPVYAPSFGWENQGVELDQGQFLFSAYYHVQDPFWIGVVHTGVILVTLLFALGLATRVTSVMAWIGHAMYLHRSQTTLFGMDTMTNMGLIYLMIGPSGAALSLDRWLQVRRDRKRFGPAYVPPPVLLPSATFATRLVQVNFCYLYLMSAMSKLLGASWWNGTAPSAVLLNYSFAPFNVSLYAQLVLFLSKHRWLWETLMSGGVVFTLWTEMALPFLIWNRKMRWFMICCSVLLHTAIGLTMGLVTFSLMVMVLLLAFVPPEVVEQVLARVGQRVKNLLGPRATSAAPAAKTPGPLVMAR
jgi:hypothetical protein